MRVLFVQISDIHLNNHNVEEIEKKFEGVAKVCNSETFSDTVIVFIFSGDMTFSGKEEQFAVLNKYIDKMKQIILDEHTVEIYIAFVSGNHDCQFSKEDISGEKSVRSIIISSLTTKDWYNELPESVLSTIIEPQREYLKFKENYSQESKDDFIDTLIINTKIGDILFILLNTSWISQYKEKPSELFFPIYSLDKLIKDELPFSNYSLITTVYHHPSNWLHPDNKIDFDQRVRDISDIILVGHEHRDEQIELTNSSWSVMESVSPAFFDAENSSCSFNMFIFEDGFSNAYKVNYLWDKDIFKLQNRELLNLNKTNHISCNCPNIDTKNWINDLELPLPHYKIMRPLTLPMIFCWQELEHLYYGTEDQDCVKKTERIENNIYSTVTQKGINIIIGDTHSGKTSMAKIIYETTCNKGMNCIYIAGSEISSCKEAKIIEMIENEYVKQYNNDTLDSFRQMSSKSKILIIDNFLDTSLPNKRLGEFLNILTYKFASVIIFINSNLEISMLLSQLSKVDSELVIRTYKILPMGNVKRNEIIKKWYALGDDYVQPFDNNEDKIIKATNYINQTLSEHYSIIPAYPMNMLFWLMTIDNGVIDSSHENNYTYFYGLLIRENLIKIVPNTLPSPQAKLSIYENALSQLAYEMLIHHNNSLTIDECLKIVSNYKNEKSVQLDVNRFIELMIDANILIKTSNTNCLKFKYPYIYFYFAGKYIERNYKSKDIQNLMQYMSQHLYNETYANIMIFVCSLSINESIIDDILLNALSIFDKEKAYNFENTPLIMSEARNKIDDIFDKKNVGDENDVEEAQKNRLKERDENGIYTGQINESEDVKLDDTNAEDAAEQYYRDFYAAQKIITVLGQIIRNYPGELSGNRKEEIIREIHNLGMRLTSMFHNMIAATLDDFLSFIESRLISVSDKNIHSENATKDKEKFKDNMIGIFAILLLEFTQYILELEAVSFGDENSIITGKKILNESISGQLALFAIQFNVFHKMPIDEVIDCSKKWKTDKYEFAYMELKALVAMYLKYNTCGTDERNKLCSEFNLKKKTLLIEEQRMKNNSDHFNGSKK